MSLQRLDEARLDLERVTTRRLKQRRQSLEGLQQRLQRQHPRRVVGEARERLRPLVPEMERHLRRRLRQEQAQLEQLRGRLERATATYVQAARHDLSQKVAQLDASPLSPCSRAATPSRATTATCSPMPSR